VVSLPSSPRRVRSRAGGESRGVSGEGGTRRPNQVMGESPKACYSGMRYLDCKEGNRSRGEGGEKKKGGGGGLHQRKKSDERRIAIAKLE